MKIMKHTGIFILVFIANLAMSQKPIWEEIFTDNIETVQVRPPDNALGDPFLVLGESNSKLLLSFDLFGSEYSTFEYTLIHCDADWKPSDLLPSEYIDGYASDYITDYEYSFNTKQSYIHYQLLFPKSNMHITKSGNYILKVYPEDEADKPVFYKRIMIFDPKTTIGGRVVRPSDPSIRKRDQEIDFSVNISQLGSQFPSKELRVFIRQNSRWDNMIKDLQPLSISQGIMDYDLQKGNVFHGSNNYRYFDFSSQRYNSEYIDKIDVSGEIDQIYLLPDVVRRDQEYIVNPNLRGLYYIDTKDYPNSHIEAEYSDVHFTLLYDVPLLDGDVYVVGNLTNWFITPYNKMTYNYERKAYETTLYLKQGFYSYMYAFLPNDSKTANVTFFEGSHYQTQNHYYIFVYYRAPGTTYDQLVGLAVLKDYSL